ncbi:MAG: hypothetical protein R3Y43_02475 [Alphaproteobacteria bacterium]
MNEFQQKLVDFKAIILSLQNVLQKENDALEKFDINTATSLYNIKNKTVGVYRDYISYFIKNNQQLQELKEEDKATLKDIIKELDNKLAKNDILLKTRIDISKKVMNSIVNIAKTQNKTNSTSYGKMGNYTQREKQYNSIAINQML